MIANFFVKIFPHIFVISFDLLGIFSYLFYENELIKPFISFLIIYSWICHDTNRFRPVWLLAFGLFYDFLKDGIVGITPLFFIILYHLQQKNRTVLFHLILKKRG